MRFLVDAQLPARLARVLLDAGHAAAFIDADFIELGTEVLVVHPRHPEEP